MARATGTQKNSKELSLKSVAELAWESANDVKKGNMNYQEGNSVAALLRTIVGAAKVQLDAQVYASGDQEVKLLQ